MLTSRLLLIWAAVLASGAMHVVGAQTESSATISPPASLQAPDHIDRWKRRSAQSFGRPELGCGYQYRSDDTTDTAFGTLYLYPREAELRDVSADSVLRSGVNTFKAVLELQQRRGDYESYDVAVERPDTVTIGRDAYPGRMLIYVYKRQGVAAVSLYQLHVVKDALIKVRITTSAQQFEHDGDGNGDIADLAHRLAAASVRAP